MGVDLSRFHFRARQPPNDGVVRLLTVARLVEVKGLDYALHALHAIKTESPNLRYQIAGGGPLRQALEALTDRLGLSSMVEFWDRSLRDEVRRLCDAAHLFILPSVVTRSGEEENQPVALAEAQASGLPIIATAIGGVAESIRDGKSGVLVPQRDSVALGAAIVELGSSSRKVAREMGAAGRGLGGRRALRSRMAVRRVHRPLTHGSFAEARFIGGNSRRASVLALVSRR